MFHFGALCPHCDEKFKLSKIGLDAKEFIQCLLCRKLIKLDLADPEKKQYGFRMAQTEFRPQTVIVSQGARKGDSAMLKIGDRFKDKTTGKIYIIRMETDNDTLCLEGENGLGRRLTGRRSLNQTCDKLGDIAS